jgi:hypothetical protein
MGPEVEPAGGLTGYMTMMGAMGQNIDRNARLGALLKDQPYLQAQQAAQTQETQAQTQGQQLQNQNMPLTMQNATYGSPFQQQQAQQAHQQQLLQMQMSQQNVQRQQQHEQAIESRYADMARHNVETERLGAIKEQAAMAVADPFGLLGANTGAPQGQQTQNQTPQDQPQAQGAPGPQTQAMPQGNIRSAMQDPNLSGDSFLKQIPIPMAQQVKQMVEGRIPPPGSFAIKTPFWQGMLQLANKYDPTFDMTTWSERVQTAKDFSSGGVSGKRVTAANQVANHMERLAESINGLGNTNVPGLTAGTPAANWFLDKTSPDFQTKKANVAKDVGAVSAELMKLFAGSTQSQREIQHWRDSFDTDKSQMSLQGGLREGVQLIDGALEALDSSYKRGMKSDRSVLDLLEPKTKAIFSKFGSNYVSSQNQGQPTPQAVPTQTGVSAPSGAEQYPTATAPNGRKAIFKDGKWQTMP